MSDTARRIVEAAEIPSIPHVLQSILALTSDPASSSRELEKKIQAEPGLVTHLLKTVNSAYFGLSRKISSLQQAIVLLGYTSVRSIASGLILINTFDHLPGHIRKYLPTVWAHSLTAAGLTRVIARPAIRSKLEELFLAAMVHNVGHLVLAQHFDRKYDELVRANPFPPVEEESLKFEVDHTDVGATLLEYWKFGPEIIDLVRAHHSPSSYPGDPAVVGTLVLSEALARKGDGLIDFLDLSEPDVEPELLAMLSPAGWTWDELSLRSDAISQSVDSTRQTMK